jgi:hypothetical protein
MLYVAVGKNENDRINKTKKGEKEKKGDKSGPLF